MEASEHRNPYAAPTAAVPPQRGEEGLVKASRVRRLLAHLLDLSILLAPAVVAVVVLLATSLNLTARGVLIVAAVASVLILSALQLVPLSRTGQTFGKRLFGLRVVRIDGARATLPRIVFLRGLVPAAVCCIPFAGPAFILIDAAWIFGQSSRCLRDHLADTMVVNA